MKPDLDLVEPRGVGGSKMERQPSSSSDPFHNIRVLMEGQIVDNNVKVLVGMGSIQPLEEIQKNMAVVAIHTAGLHRALMHHERSQQTSGAVAGVGCCMPFGIPRSERMPSKRSGSRVLRRARKRTGSRKAGSNVWSSGVIGPRLAPAPITISEQARAGKTAYPVSGWGT